MRVAVWLNPNSGRGRAAEAARRIGVELERAGHAVAVRRIGAADPVPAGSLNGRHHSEDPCDCLVVVGGDGTVHHAAPVAMRLGVPIYQIPMGTENLFSREFGMTRDPAQLIGALERMNVLETDVGVVNGRTFLLMCSVGPDAGVVRRLAAARSGTIGHWSYAAPIFREMLSPSLEPLTVSVDGKNIVVAAKGLIVVANSKHYGGRINPAARASVSDGLLDVVFLPASSAMGLVGCGIACARGKQFDRSRIVHARGSDIRIENAGEPLPYQLDGEAGERGEALEPRSNGEASHSDPGTTPVSIRVMPRALKVLSPRVSIASAPAEAPGGVECAR